MKPTDHDLLGLFGSEELEEIERRWSDGISAQRVISLFHARGVKLSEATFRKYVQLGLLPTSRRIGRKGKHRGSQGIYPVSVVRRINVIKHMMMEGMTLEEIRDSFLSVQNGIERTSDALERLFGLVRDRLERLREESESSKSLSKELEVAWKNARSFMKRMEKIGSRLAGIGSLSEPEDQGGLP